MKIFIPRPNKRTGKILNCLRCGKEKYVSKYRVAVFKYCSDKCSNVKGECKNTGRTHFKKGENKGRDHRLWKGERASYSAKHYWIERELGKPMICDFCGDTQAPRYEWANKSGLYLRELTDWIRLCKRCHNEYDNVYQKMRVTMRARIRI